MRKKSKKIITEEETLLKKYRQKLIGEAVIKSMIVGLTGGFLLSVLVSVISLITSFDTLWIALVVLGVSAAGFTVLTYFRIYRVNIRKTAARVDEIGLEERVITMVEYAGKDDILSKKQRADTQRALQFVVPKQMKIPFPKISVAILVVAALLSVFMMTTASVRVVEANTPTPAEEQSEPTEEDKIIAEMIADLRRVIEEANVKQELKDTLNGMVDDLEASLSPTDSTEVKIAKISETSQKIHRILKEELSKTTIAEELQKHSTTKKLGQAIESGEGQKIEDAFQAMYDSIAPLVGEEKYDVLIQTATDIFQSLEDATAETEDALAQALEDLANAMLDAIPENPPIGGEEDRVNDEINKALEDAMQEAMDAVKEALKEQEEIENADQSIQDIMKDAMEQLGQDSSSDSSDDNESSDSSNNGEEDSENESDETGPAHPAEDGEIIYDTVIDGKTPYMDVYDEYYEQVIELLTSGELSEEQRRIIENYFNILN